VGWIENILNEIAPVETAESYDNVGAIVGRRDAEVTKILVALDCTLDVVREAKELGAELIVTHHPLLFHAGKTAGRRRRGPHPVRNGAFPAFSDRRPYQSGSDGAERQRGCARLMNLKNVRKETNYLFFGELDKPMKAKNWRADCPRPFLPGALLRERRKADFHPGYRRRRGRRRLADRTGPRSAGTAYGEVRHHNALAAAMSDFVLFDGGHYAQKPLWFLF
jgi:hypothetical protein